MVQIIWEFRVNRRHHAEFERVYGPDGLWTELFRKAAGFRRTTLLRDLFLEGRYIVMDEWQDLIFFQDFREKFAADYERLDKECEELTDEEIPIGILEGL